MRIDTNVVCIGLWTGYIDHHYRIPIDGVSIDYETLVPFCRRLSRMVAKSLYSRDKCDQW
jgi:hypothetical protein